MGMNIREKLELLPDQPGIYRFLSDQKKIIYVGKAKNLKHRVRSYFIDSNLMESRTINLKANIDDVEWIVTNTEAEALILEDKLIKTHKPRYNIGLKDDKSYPYFKVTVHEQYPKLSLVRELDKDGSLYFGPYVSVIQARAVWKVINKHFPLCRCKRTLDGKKIYKPCLNYQLKRCMAPCAGLISPEDYRKIVDSVLQLLRGNFDELLDSLKKEMAQQAETLNFEEAAKIRDQISAVRQTLQKQRIVTSKKTNQDILYLLRFSGYAGVQALFVRNGILLSDDFFLFRDAERFDDQEIIRSVISRLYIAGNRFLPKEILVPFEYEDATMFEAYCLTDRDTRVNVITPKRGDKKVLLDMAQKNAEQNLQIKLREEKADEETMTRVQQHLKLMNLPYRVECFDISNIAGTSMVGSMVVWENNRAKKSDYRKYKIKTVDQSNDYAAMEEVLKRRYSRLIKENQDFPDLILIDGGKGQLSSAESILTTIGLPLDQIDLIGLAKGRSEKRAGVKNEIEDVEYVVKPNRKNPIRLRKNSATLFFLQNVRDEAHRFAITYHRQLRGSTSLKSGLDDIPGVGPKKRGILLKQFKSVKKIREATVEELAGVKGISEKDAETIRGYYDSLNRPDK